MKTGLKIKEYCSCGKYKPISTKGVIILKCKNCGKLPKPIKFK